jgi:hypothetical protein
MTTTATTTKEVFLNTTELARRGWTEAMIKKFMPEPDRKKEQRWGPEKSARLYLMTRVEEIESTLDWQKAKALARTRREVALQAVTPDPRTMKAIEQAVVRAVTMQFREEQKRQDGRAAEVHHAVMEDEMERGD